MLCGCQGVNGGGWAHYVGQEKVRPLTGFQQVAFGWTGSAHPAHDRHLVLLPAHRPVALRELRRDELASPLGRGLFRGRAFADTHAQASRMGWTPSIRPSTATRSTSPTRPRGAGKSVTDYVVDELKAGRLRFAGEDPDDPANFPRVMTVWRANLLGSSGKGMEYFMRHLLGVEDAVRAEESPERLRAERSDLARGGAAGQAATWSRRSTSG